MGREHNRDQGNNPTNTTDPSGLVDYKKNFLDETPAAKDAGISWWPIHHTKQQRLRERYWKEKGIDVDSAEHLVAVHPEVHKEITGMQRKWRDDLMRQKGLNPGFGKDVERFWKEVPWSKVKELEKDLERAYGKWWVEAGSSQKTIENVRRLVDGEQRLSRFALGKGARMRKIFKRLITGLAIFAILEENVGFAASIAGHNRAQREAWDHFKCRYDAILTGAANGYIPTKQALGNLTDDYINYLIALKASDTVIAVARETLEVAIADAP